jgi:hypothetical protein
MKLRTFLIILCSLLLLPEVVSADVIFPLTFITLPFLPFILLIEIVVFAAYYDFILKSRGVELSFKDLLLGIFAANLVSSAIGLIFPAHEDVAILFFSAYLTSIFVEFPVYMAFFKIEKMELFKISFLTNLASYSAIFAFLLLMR